MQVLGSGRVQAEMNITPFIDVLLVLLVIFMLSIKVRHIMEAQLARQEGGTSGTNAIVLELSNDGQYLLNTVPVPAARLESTLREVFAVRSEKVLFIRAGAKRLYGETIAVMDVARGAGVQVIGLAP